MDRPSFPDARSHRPDIGAVDHISPLRPDLAAFFTLSRREIPPGRIRAEQGILAELAMRGHFD